MSYTDSIVNVLNALEELKMQMQKQSNMDFCEQCISSEILIQQIEPLEDILYHNLKAIGYYNIMDHLLVVQK